MKKPTFTNFKNFKLSNFLIGSSAVNSINIVAAIERDGDNVIVYPEGMHSIAISLAHNDVNILSHSYSILDNNIEVNYYNLKINRFASCVLLTRETFGAIWSGLPTISDDQLRAAATLQVSIELGANGEGTLSYGGTKVRCLGKPGQPYPSDLIVENIEGVQYEGDYGKAFKFKRWVSKEFQGPDGNPAIMLWSVKIDGSKGIFIHEDPDTIESNGGQPSQGCIHLADPNAKNFYNWITARTRVQISFPWGIMA